MSIKMLSICVVTQQYQQVISGIGLHTRNLVSRLVSDGHRVTVVAPLDQSPSGKGNFRFIGVAPPLFKRNQARWFSLALSFARVLRLLELQEEFDLIHFTDARESLFCHTHTPTVGNVNDTYAAEVQSPSYYRRYYNDWALRWVYYRFVRYCESLALPRLKAIIANSHYTAKIIASQYHVPNERLYICYKSIDPEHYASVLTSRRSRSSRFHVLFVGGNMQRKGLPILIEAAPQILEELPNTEFWVVGNDAAISRMKDLCRTKGVDSNFCFWGWKPHDELLQLYAQADVFVMPSLVEAFGVVFLEAMACGVPAIGSSVGGIPEIVRHGYNGLLISPGNADKLAVAVSQVLRNASLQKRLREGGLETVQRFSVGHMMECTYQVYKTLLGSPAC